MSNILKVGRRNNIEIVGRRYSLSKLVSESYQTLYDCELDSKLYRLTESHINSIRNRPEAISLHSRNLEVLKGLVKLGESAKIRESDIPDEEEIEDPDTLEEDADMEEIEDEDVINEDSDMEELEDEDVINEDADMEELDDEDVINEDADMEELEDEDVINEDADMEELEDEDVINEEAEIDDEDEDSAEITQDELVELKKHLKEIRRARRRARESAEADGDMHDPDLAECPERMKKTGRFPESRTWKSEKSSMTKALKNFRESSNKKAFYKSFKKLQESMKSGNPLSLEESILLYKASNSAMTHLTVELEHNPGFIYTFRECTSMLARDNAKLLECIRKQVSPSKSLLESYKNFSSILLESEDSEDELADEEDAVLPNDEVDEFMNVKGTLDASGQNVGILGGSGISNGSSKSDVDEFLDADLTLDASGQSVGILGGSGVKNESSGDEEVEEEIPAPEEEEVLAEEEGEEEIPAEETPLASEEEDLDEEEDDLSDEITDEEAEALKNKLMELRSSRKYK